MADESFFETSTDQSQTKTKIVSKYFSAWAKVILSTKQSRIMYIDLFCGPGRYNDGIESTPLAILRNAVADHNIAHCLITFFVDENPEFVETLYNEISKISNLNILQSPPDLRIGKAEEEYTKISAETGPYPTLSFLDPWGYKGLSIHLIKSVLKDWGSDSIVFFNYNRINAALDNEEMKIVIDGLFGIERAEKLRMEANGLKPEDREQLIMQEFRSALNEVKGRYCLTYRFEFTGRKRTSHYLVFVTKHELGYATMKSIMAKESKHDQEGIPLFEHPSTSPKQISLFTDAIHP